VQDMKEPLTATVRWQTTLIHATRMIPLRRKKISRCERLITPFLCIPVPLNFTIQDYHPSTMLNEYLLSTLHVSVYSPLICTILNGLQTGITVAITHDDVWCSVLGPVRVDKHSVIELEFMSIMRLG
jgi:hypothetical protein